MTADINLVAEDVHITYRTYLDPQVELRHRLRAGPRATKRRHIDVHAVRGVSFDLHQGESLGLVGHNGAGKSTILLGLAGLIQLDSGRVLARTRPRLLGVGSVLNTHLSGRRNIEIGCLAAGMTRAEIDERMESLIGFSGLDEFIDLPLKAYSSGMRARLSFTVATVFEHDVLLIDEALAVGDVDFRHRAQRRIEEIRSAAGSVVLVSHNSAELERMCDRIIWLHHGRAVREGTPRRILSLYTATRANPDLLESIASTDVAGIGPLRPMPSTHILQARYGGDQVAPGSPIDQKLRSAQTSLRRPDFVDLDDAAEVEHVALAEMFRNTERPQPPADDATLSDWLIDHDSGALLLEWHSPSDPRQAILLGETYSPWFTKWRSGWSESDLGHIALDRHVPETTVARDLIYCGTRFPEHFTHWWIDVAARVNWALRSSECDELGIIVPQNLTTYQRDALTAIGLTEDRIYRPAAPMERISRIHFPGMLQRGARSATAVDGAAIDAALTARRAVAPNPAAPHRRLYVSRRGEPNRRVLNETEVEAVLSDRGFEIVRPSTLSFSETVQLFAEAAVVTGATGDGMANIVFCTPGATIVEVLPDTYQASHIWAIASAVGCTYSAIAGRASGDGRSTPDAAIDDNLRIPIPSLERAVDRMARPAPIPHQR